MVKINNAYSLSDRQPQTLVTQTTPNLLKVITSLEKTQCNQKKQQLQATPELGRQDHRNLDIKAIRQALEIIKIIQIFISVPHPLHPNHTSKYRR